MFSGSEVLNSLLKEIIKAGVTSFAVYSTSKPVSCPAPELPLALYSCPAAPAAELPPLVCNFVLPDSDRALIVLGVLTFGAVCFAAGRLSVRKQPRGQFLDARRPVPSTGLRGTR